jgi:uncharacterized protein YndB with AHSA1/START domain
MSTEPLATIRVTRRFSAAPDRVFDAWLDPEQARRWLFATASGQMVRAEVDARVGGRFTFTDRRGAEDVEHTGEYLEIDRPRRLVFAFSVPKYSSMVTRVSVAIEPLGTGCELTLIHDNVLPEHVSRGAAGWGMVLDGLAVAVGEGGPETVSVTS